MKLELILGITLFTVVINFNPYSHVYCCNVYMSLNPRCVLSAVLINEDCTTVQYCTCHIA